jgi:hypothetical protein
MYKMFDVPFNFIKESDFYCQACFKFFGDNHEYAIHIETPKHKNELSKFCCGIKFQGGYGVRKHQLSKYHARHKDGFKTKTAAWAAYHRANTAYWTYKPI